MYLTAVFVSSGVLTASLIVAKWFEQRYRRSFFILKIVSRGDEKVREWAHAVAHKYSEMKERVNLLITKQMPLRIRGFINKHTESIRQKMDTYTEKARDSRLLSKKEGISEFFQSISTAEKGSGEINDVLEDISQNSQDEVK